MIFQELKPTFNLHVYGWKEFFLNFKTQLPFHCRLISLAVLLTTTAPPHALQPIRIFLTVEFTLR